MEDHHNSSKLHSIYAALDSHQYTRALKLTQHKSVCAWKITLALRCHTLRRIGRKEECIALLKKSLLGYIKVKTENDELGEFLNRLRRQKNDWKGDDEKYEIADAFERLDSPLTKTFVEAEAEDETEIITDEVRTMILTNHFVYRFYSPLNFTIPFIHMILSPNTNRLCPNY